MTFVSVLASCSHLPAIVGISQMCISTEYSSACCDHFFLFFFFFLMIRRPPRSTLFPTRRSSDLPPSLAAMHGGHVPHVDAWLCPGAPRLRSEEHTSELQSPVHLVCRLLLEKKKINTARPRYYRSSATCSPRLTFWFV